MITVCVPTFNGEKYVAAQLLSILASPLVDEVLVSDDGSSDRTTEVVLGLNDSRITLFKGPSAGLIRNYEFLLSKASGTYIFLADQDDIWFPEKVQTLLIRLQTVDLVVSDCRVVNEDLSLLSPSFFQTRHSGPGIAKNLLKNTYLGCCIAFRRSLLKHILPFPKSTPMHDWWIGLVAELFGKVEFLPQPLVLYRRHDSNASTTSERSSVSRSKQLRWRTSLMCSLLCRFLRR